MSIDLISLDLHLVYSTTVCVLESNEVSRARLRVYFLHTIFSKTLSFSSRHTHLIRSRESTQRPGSLPIQPTAERFISFQSFVINILTYILVGIYPGGATVRRVGALGGGQIGQSVHDSTSRGTYHTLTRSYNRVIMVAYYDAEHM